VVERWQEGTPQQFWDEFSNNGTALSFTAIHTQLRKKQVAEDKMLADQAREEYGAFFEEKFRYRTGGQMKVMVDPTHIAKRYHSLQTESN